MRNWLLKWWRFSRHRRQDKPNRAYRPILEGLEQRSLPSADFSQTNLVSNVAGQAPVTDARLVNPWGVAINPAGAIWVANNNSGVSSLYTGTGAEFPVGSPLTVTIPTPAGGTPPSAPTGVVFNSTSDFVVSSGGQSAPALFIFATEDGTISAWSQTVDGTNAIREVDNSASGAVYKGLALGSNASGNFLFAANFNTGKVDVFDTHFAAAKLAGSFTDPDPALTGFAPFDIRNINGQLFVTYAKQDAAKHDDVAGPGNGFVDVFDTNGILIKRFATQGTLNSPWGLTLAPTGFGGFNNALFVGNFGDGRVNAFDASSGASLGQLNNTTGSPLTIDGLWSLNFGLGGTAGDPNTLYFTAGPNNQNNGLFGTLLPAPAPTPNPQPPPLTPNQHLLAKFYRDLLGRTVDPSGQASWGGMLDQGVPPMLVALGIERSQEFRLDEVEQLYSRYLHRPADPGGAAFDVSFLEAGGSIEALAVDMISSPEYLQLRAGGTTEGFFNALVSDTFNRPLDAVGHSVLSNLLSDGDSPSEIALAVIRSETNREVLVGGFYARFLHRAGEVFFVNGWSSLMRAGARDEQVIAGFLSSPEYLST
jgi:uncharacterized protein (TIGR03118 family)